MNRIQFRWVVVIMLALTLLVVLVPWVINIGKAESLINERNDTDLSFLLEEVDITNEAQTSILENYVGQVGKDESYSLRLYFIESEENQCAFNQENEMTYQLPPEVIYTEVEEIEVYNNEGIKSATFSVSDKGLISVQFEQQIQELCMVIPCFFNLEQNEALDFGNNYIVNLTYKDQPSPPSEQVAEEIEESYIPCPINATLSTKIEENQVALSLSISEPEVVQEGDYTILHIESSDISKVLLYGFKNSSIISTIDDIEVVIGEVTVTENIDKSITILIRYNQSLSDLSTPIECNYTIYGGFYYVDTVESDQDVTIRVTMNDSLDPYIIELPSGTPITSTTLSIRKEGAPADPQKKHDNGHKNVECYTRLPGVTYKLTGYDEETVEEPIKTTDENGILTFSIMKPGTYTLHELRTWETRSLTDYPIDTYLTEFLFVNVDNIVKQYYPIGDLTFTVTEQMIKIPNLDLESLLEWNDYGNKLDIVYDNITNETRIINHEVVPILVTKTFDNVGIDAYVAKFGIEKEGLISGLRFNLYGLKEVSSTDYEPSQFRIEDFDLNTVIASSGYPISFLRPDDGWYVIVEEISGLALSIFDTPEPKLIYVGKPTGTEFKQVFNMDSFYTILNGYGNGWTLGTYGLNNSGDIFSIGLKDTKTGEEYESFCANSGSEHFAGQGGMGCTGYLVSIGVNKANDYMNMKRFLSAYNYIYDHASEYGFPVNESGVLDETLGTLYDSRMEDTHGLRVVTQVVTWALLPDDNGHQAITLETLESINNSSMSEKAKALAKAAILYSVSEDTGSNTITDVFFLVCDKHAEHYAQAINQGMSEKDSMTFAFKQCQPQIIPIYNSYYVDNPPVYMNNTTYHHEWYQSPVFPNTGSLVNYVLYSSSITSLGIIIGGFIIYSICHKRKHNN